MWQKHWGRLVVFPFQHYNAPVRAVGRRYIEAVATILDDVKARKCNMEKFVVFQMVILQRTRNVKRAGGIKKRILKRLDAWEAGKYTNARLGHIARFEDLPLFQAGRLSPRAEGKDLLSDGNSRRTASRGQVFDRQGKGSIMMPGTLTTKMETWLPQYWNPSIQMRGFRMSPFYIPTPKHQTSWILISRRMLLKK
jgi:hypothetical protein